MSDQLVYVIQHYERERFDPIEYQVFSAEERDEMRKSEYVGYHKIGISSEPRKRLSMLRGGTPHELRLITTICVEGDAEQVEREFHHFYRGPYDRTDEWFRLPVDHIEQLKAVEILRPGEIEAVADVAREAGDLSVTQPREINLVEALEQVRKSGQVGARE